MFSMILRCSNRGQCLNVGEMDRAFVAGREPKIERAEGWEGVNGGEGEKLEVVIRIGVSVVGGDEVKMDEEGGFGEE